MKKKITLKENQLLGLFENYINREDFKFRSKFTNYSEIDFIDFNYKGLKSSDNYDIDSYNFIVEWELDMDIRNEGINGIYVNIINIVGEIEIVLYDQSGDKSGEDVVEFDLSQMGFEMNSNLETATYGSLFPNNLEIDFNNKKATVTF